jgi:hypothetical protein
MTIDSPDQLGSAPNSRDRSRLGVVIALVGAGLLVQGIADALARGGDSASAMALFLTGMALIFGVCAWRLTGAAAGRNERLWVSLVLGLGLLASYLMRRPLLTTRFDELDHVATLSHLSSSHALFPANTYLPVGPYYAGLELSTLATRWLTGLPVTVDEVIVLIAVRVLLILAVFLLVERVCKSSRAGGVGALVYMSNPQFYAFDSQYAYETMALALAAAAVYLLFVSIDKDSPGWGRLSGLALCGIAATVVTHHLTGWLTVGFVTVWAIALVLSARYRRVPAIATGGNRLWAVLQSRLDSVANERSMRARWRQQAHVIRVAAAVSIIVGAAWTLFAGSRLTGYIGPILSSAVADFGSALGGLHGNRELFKNAAGGVTPTWDILLILGSAAAWCLILVAALYSTVFKRSVRGGPLRFLPAIIAALYPLLILANVSSASKLVAGRAAAFVFFGMAVVVGAWLAARMARVPRLTERVGIIGIAILCAVGGILFGSGPVTSVLPGRYQVGADELSLGAPSLAVAHWAAMNIPAGTHVAVDLENGDLLNAIGGVNPVTPQSGLKNPESIFFDHRLTPFDISLIRRSEIRYVFVDDRLPQGLPLYGTYVADGEPHTRLTLAQLDKFDSYPGIRRVYDNGPIKVYDLSALLPPSERVAPSTAPAGGVGSGIQVWVLVLAVFVVARWLQRLRRRRESLADTAHRVVCGLLVAMLLGIAGVFLIRLTRLPHEIVVVAVLLALAALSFWPRRHDAPVTDPPRTRRSQTQLLFGVLGVVLLGAGTSIATVAALREWTPPPELAAVSRADGRVVAQVQLGSAGAIPARLIVADARGIIWATDLATSAGPQQVELPDGVSARAKRVALLANGRVLRKVDG